MKITPILALMLVSGAVHAQSSAYKSSGATGYGGYAAASQQHGSTAYGSQVQSNSLAGVNGAITQRYSNASSVYKRDDMASAELGATASGYGGKRGKTSLNPSTPAAQLAK